MTVGPYKNMPEHLIDDVQKEINNQYDIALEKMAKDHGDWFIEMIRPLIFYSFLHGYKRGKEDK